MWNKNSTNSVSSFNNLPQKKRKDYIKPRMLICPLLVPDNDNNKVLVPKHFGLAMDSQ